MTPFLKSVAEYLHNQYGNKLHTIAVIFPNKRARLFFSQELAKLTDKPLLAPRYYTINEYLQSLSGYTPADQLTLLFSLYDVFVKITGSNESFDSFLFYCEMLLADFDDLDKYLVDPSMLFKNLSDLKDLESYFDYLEPTQIQAIQQFWQTFSDSKESDQKQKFSSLWEVLFKIYTEFNQTLKDRELSYEGMAFRKSVEKIKEGNINTEESKIAFVGFNALNKCEQELFKYLKKKDKGLFFWDYDKYYLYNVENHEAAFFLNSLLYNYPAPKDFSFSSHVVNPEREIDIYDIATVTGQAKILPQIINTLPENWTSSPTNTAIALAEESLLLPVLNALPATIDQVNISMGYPLKDTKAYNLLCLLLDLHKNRRINNNEVTFYHKDIINILYSPLIAQQDNNNTLQEALVKNNQAYISPKQIEAGNELIQFIFENNTNPDSFIQYLKEILKQLRPESANNKNNYLIEREAIFRIHRQLNRIGEILNTIDTTFNFNSLTRLLAKAIESTTIPFSGEPLQGLQVMGVLETRSLDFENLIILSLNEGIFPKSGNVPSFIPYSLRKGFDMPTIEHQDAIFAYYFYRLLHRAKNVKLVYSSSVKDSKSGEPSRLIQQLIYEKSFKIKQHTYSYNVSPLGIPELNIPKSKDTLELLKIRFNPNENRLLSPSAINTYLNCKTRFYFHYVNGIKEPQTLMEEIEANTFGSILHKTMEYLYKPLLNRVVTKSDIDSIRKNKKLLSNSLTQAFWEEYLGPGKPFPGLDNVSFKGKNQLIKDIIYRYLENILEFDASQAPVSFFGLEERVSKPYMTASNISVKIGGIIDRIDEVNNNLRIIDYKTGKAKNTFDSVESLFESSEKRNDAAFQTLLYAIVLANEKTNRTIVPGLYFVRSIKTKNYSPTLLIGPGRKAKQPIDSVELVQSEFENHLQQTLNEIFNEQGDFNQTDQLERCDYCPYKNMCGR